MFDADRMSTSGFDLARANPAEPILKGQTTSCKLPEECQWLSFGQTQTTAYLLFRNTVYTQAAVNGLIFAYRKEKL